MLDAGSHPENHGLEDNPCPRPPQGCGWEDTATRAYRLPTALKNV
jgi:hypothetical protein